MNPDQTETSAYASSIDKIQDDEAGPEEGKWQSHEATPRAKTNPWQVPGSKTGEEIGVLLRRSRSKLHIRGSSQFLQRKMQNHGMSNDAFP